jgi:fumarate hydratase, class II
MHNIPVGIEAKGLRIETESIGAIVVPADRFWAALIREAAIHSAVGGVGSAGS